MELICLRLGYSRWDAHYYTIIRSRTPANYLVSYIKAIRDTGLEADYCLLSVEVCLCHLHETKIRKRNTQRVQNAAWL